MKEKGPAKQSEYKTMTITVPPDVYEALVRRCTRVHLGMVRPSTMAALACSDEVRTWKDDWKP